MNKTIPELLAPAGSLEKLKVAVLYGADAVYLGGQRYSLRARADNFTNAEIKEGVEFAHKHNAKAYITLNAYLHDEDLLSLIDYCKFLESINVDAVIVSDLGVMETIKKSSNLKIHLSTQASCINEYAAKVWKEHGVERIVVGRELSIEETAIIKESCGIEVEMFVHGAMCMSYSGACSISNFTAGRDSNRGGCIQSCRFLYKQTNKLNNTSHFISSKDMKGISLIPDFINNKIDSLKLEGRMKSVLHVATLCYTYKQAIKSYLNDRFEENLNKLEKNLDSIPHRDYFPASFETPAPSNSTYQKSDGTVRRGTHQFVGLILDSNKDTIALRTNFLIKKGDCLEFLLFNKDPISTKLDKFYDITGKEIESPKQDCLIYIPKTKDLDEIQQYNVVRTKRENVL